MCITVSKQEGIELSWVIMHDLAEKQSFLYRAEFMNFFKLLYICLSVWGYVYKVQLALYLKTTSTVWENYKGWNPETLYIAFSGGYQQTLCGNLKYYKLFII